MCHQGPRSVILLCDLEQASSASWAFISSFVRWTSDLWALNEMTDVQEPHPVPSFISKSEWETKFWEVQKMRFLISSQPCESFITTSFQTKALRLLRWARDLSQRSVFWLILSPLSKAAGADESCWILTVSFPSLVGPHRERAGDRSPKMSLAFSNPHCSSSPTAISTVLLVTHRYTSNLQSPSHPVCSHFQFSMFSTFPLLGGRVRTPEACTLKWGPEFLEMCISWDFWSTHMHIHTHSCTNLHTHSCTNLHAHTPSAINREDRISQVSVACHQWMRAPSLSWKFLELITDGFWTMREKAWHEGSCDPCHSDDLAASLDPESAPAVRASGKYLRHEDKATHASCCLLAYPHPIYSGSSVKQMFQPYICKCFWL